MNTGLAEQKKEINQARKKTEGASAGGWRRMSFFIRSKDPRETLAARGNRGRPPDWSEPRTPTAAIDAPAGSWHHGSSVPVACGVVGAALSVLDRRAVP